MAKQKRQRPERPSRRRAQESRTTPSAAAWPRYGAGPFVGRERELDELGRLFDRGAWLVTLVGAGGVGKTRLALEAVGRGAAGRGTPYFVDLATLDADDDVVRAIISALRAAGEAILQSEAALLATPALSESLLVLDNCDHVLRGCARIAEALLRRDAGVRILATSREALAIGGETPFAVEPLPLPPAGADDVETLRSSDAVTLFLARAETVLPGFELSTINAPHVAQICRRLDGLPLAIELAAARVRVLAPHQITGRLDHRFDLLRDQRQDGAPHHRTLHAAIAWSYQLLTPGEQTLLDRLAVFAGGATLEALEAVCTGGPVDRTDVIDLLTRLADKSLVTVEITSGADARYRLLESIREFGRERLDAAGETAALQARHATWFDDLAARAEPELWGSEQRVWLKHLAAEHDNLRVAIERSLPSAPERALRIVGHLWRYCELAGRLAEGSRWLEAAMAAVRADNRASREYARASFGAGYLARDQGDLIAARRLFEQSLRIFRERGDLKDVGSSLRALAVITQAEGDHERAQALFREALELFHQVGHHLGVGWTLRNLGLVAQALGDEREAAALFETALPVLRKLDDRPGLARTLGSLAILARLEGAYAESRARLEEALALVREAGDQRGVAMMLAALGMLAYVERAPQRARDNLRDALQISERAGDWACVAFALAMFGTLAIDAGRLDEGLAAITAATAVDAGLPARLARDERAAIDAARDRARAALGQAALRIEDRAASAPWSEAIALGARLAGAPEPATASAGPLTKLTPRQVEVLRLIARGRTNRQIAAELALSEYTVMRHVSNLFDRLNVSSRAAAAAIASSEGIV
jgi:predicted ATPase/DNA-binding CsgD family transcriptional regulator